MLKWTYSEIIEYIDKYKLPKHPLFGKGFKSIGCMPCTIPVSDAQEIRAGRWPNSVKTECGIHTMLSKNSASMQS